MPRLSVIIPVYNVEKYLKECFQSLISQPDSSEVELIFVDDGSSDSSGRLLDQLVENSRNDFKGNIFVVHQNNEGLSAARNTGLAHASGDWIAFVDSDDILFENVFKSLLETIEKNSDVDLISFNARRIHSAGALGDKMLFSVENKVLDISSSQQKFDYLAENFLNYEDGWEAWNRIYKHSIIKENDLRFSPTKEVLAEDLLFNLNYLLYTNRILKLCNIFYGYRINENSLIENVKEETILHRITRLLHIFYNQCQDKFIKKNFYRIYFTTVNFQIQYKLDDLSIETIRTALYNEADKYKEQKKVLKQIRTERNFFDEKIKFRHWLEK